MAIAALPARGMPGFRHLRRQALAAAARLLTPARPVLRNLAAIPFTVAGWGLMSAAAFQVGTTIGLAASGVILMVLEHQIADQ